MNHYSLNAKDFSEKLGVQRSNISHLLSGRNKPSVGFITSLTEHFPEVEVKWLLHGKGDMITIVKGAAEREEVTIVNDKEQPVKEVVTPKLKEDTSVTSQPTQRDNTTSKERRVKHILVVYTNGDVEQFAPQNFMNSNG
ncbi:MAG: helix-turn-helix transcriptional regulator [Flavobacteriales bacterium]|nr:helix-turn-helix transcriptional regulator [Flavobacteriales bacterium]